MIVVVIVIVVVVIVVAGDILLNLCVIVDRSRILQRCLIVVVYR